MADENKESVLDEKTTQKQSSNGASLQLSTIALILAIATFALGVFVALLAQFVDNFTVIRILNCICYVVYAVTMAFYILDITKFKNFSVNATLVLIVLATIVMF